MVDLFNEIIQARRIAVVAKIAAGVALENEEQDTIMSLLADMSGDLSEGLYQREKEMKSLDERGFLINQLQSSRL